jgi:RNA polymerase sigma-70 factor (ECF subfamily)
MHEGSGHGAAVRRSAGRRAFQRGWVDHGPGNDGSRHADHEQDDARVQAAIACAKAGDRHAVRFLYARYADTVRRYVAGLLGDAEEAQDITQTVFLKLLTKLDRYEPRACRFDAWLLRVARNTTFDEIRRRRPVPAGEAIEYEAAVTPDVAQNPGFTLTAALARLPVAQREVLVLRHLVGLSPGEIALRLERTESSINNLHHRGRTNLRQALTSLEQAPATPRARSTRHGERRTRRPVVQLAAQGTG